MRTHLQLRPIRFRQACDYIALHHRHHRPPQGWLFGIACLLDGEMVGVVTVGRPVARLLDDGITCEVTRCCTDGTRNVCSFLYGAARRAARAMGYARIITYTLSEEAGTSLKAAGWRPDRATRGSEWNTPSRRRRPADNPRPKMRWRCELGD